MMVMYVTFPKQEQERFFHLLKERRQFVSSNEERILVIRDRYESRMQNQETCFGHQWRKHQIGTQQAN